MVFPTLKSCKEWMGSLVTKGTDTIGTIAHNISGRRDNSRAMVMVAWDGNDRLRGKGTLANFERNLNEFTLKSLNEFRYLPLETEPSSWRTITIEALNVLLYGSVTYAIYESSSSFHAEALQNWSFSEVAHSCCKSSLAVALAALIGKGLLHPKTFTTDQRTEIQLKKLWRDFAENYSHKNVEKMEENIQELRRLQVAYTNQFSTVFGNLESKEDFEDVLRKILTVVALYKAQNFPGDLKTKESLLSLRDGYESEYESYKKEFGNLVVRDIDSFVNCLRKEENNFSPQSPTNSKESKEGKKKGEDREVSIYQGGSPTKQD